MRAHCVEPVPDPREKLPSLPQILSRIVGRAMAKARSKRFQTAHEMAAALDAALAGRQLPPPMPIAVYPSVHRDNAGGGHSLVPTGTDAHVVNQAVAQAVSHAASPAKPSAVDPPMSLSRKHRRLSAELTPPASPRRHSVRFSRLSPVAHFALAFAVGTSLVVLTFLFSRGLDEPVEQPQNPLLSQPIKVSPDDIIGDSAAGDRSTSKQTSSDDAVRDGFARDVPPRYLPSHDRGVPPSPSLDLPAQKNELPHLNSALNQKQSPSTSSTQPPSDAQLAWLDSEINRLEEVAHSGRLTPTNREELREALVDIIKACRLCRTPDEARISFRARLLRSQTEPRLGLPTYWLEGFDWDEKGPGQWPLSTLMPLGSARDSSVCYIDPVYAHSGSQSLRLCVPEGQATPAEALRLFEQPNRPFYLGFWVRLGTETTQPSRSSYRLSVRLVAKTKTAAAQPFELFGIKDRYELAGLVVQPETWHEVLIRHERNASGLYLTTWVDRRFRDHRVLRSTAVPPVELVPLSFCVGFGTVWLDDVMILFEPLGPDGQPDQVVSALRQAMTEFADRPSPSSLQSLQRLASQHLNDAAEFRVRIAEAAAEFPRLLQERMPFPQLYQQPLPKFHPQE